jgi:hypothetical protein
MGFNTSAVILNDALSNIEHDKDIGKKIADGVSKLIYGKPVDVSAGNHCNAIYLIESHHADFAVPVIVGGNYGFPLSTSISWQVKPEDADMAMLRALAQKLGYTVSRKPSRR